MKTFFLPRKSESFTFLSLWLGGSKSGATSPTSTAIQTSCELISIFMLLDSSDFSRRYAGFRKLSGNFCCGGLLIDSVLKSLLASGEFRFQPTEGESADGERRHK